MRNSILFFSIIFLFSFTAKGYDNFLTPSIDEGAIGSGMDNFLTPLINEGPIGLNFINPYSSGIGSNSFGGSLWD